MSQEETLGLEIIQACVKYEKEGRTKKQKKSCVVMCHIKKKLKYFAKGWAPAFLISAMGYYANQAKLPPQHQNFEKFLN